jgi:hypothetical protein
MTVMVYVPAGVPLLPPPLLLVLPPPQATSKTKPVNTTHASTTGGIFPFRCCFEPKLTLVTINPSSGNQTA